MSISMDIKSQRQKLREDLNRGKTMRFVGSFSPLVSRMIEEQGFEGLYVSGAVISSDLSLPDLELITLTELVDRGGLLVRGSSLPGLADADTGFGGLFNIARTVQMLERAHFCGLHIEDQQSPKKCGHLENKKLISVSDMQKKIETALKSRRDSDFLISARTDARGVEGLDLAIKRAKAYREAGAEAIFPEALKDIGEFKQFREALDLPLIANMTEFGKSEMLSYDQLKELGYNIVLYPVTLWRLALKAVEEGLIEVKSMGHQKTLIEKMFTRKSLYKLLGYEPNKP